MHFHRQPQTHVRILLPLFAVLAPLSLAHARYARPDIEKVPVERLVKNLEERIRQKPTDAETMFNLARLHAMAYALKSDTAEVRKGEEIKGAWFGYEPAHVPFAAQPTKDEAKLKAAREHLQKAIARYEAVIKLQPDNLSARLGLAWCLQQDGQTDKARAAFRKLIADAWAKESKLESAPLGWHSVTAEAATYLEQLLDKQADKAELADLAAKRQHVEGIPRPITPLVIPLRDGLHPQRIVDAAARVRFDLDGSGRHQTWQWITPDAGWLVHAPASGKAGAPAPITSGLQLFGNVTFWLFWEHGYAALASLDDDGDGELQGRELDGLAIWRDADGNGRSEPGEVQPLIAHGIVALSCRCQPGTARQAPWVSLQGVRFSDGRVRPTWDIVLKQAP